MPYVTVPSYFLLTEYGTEPKEPITRHEFCSGRFSLVATDLRSMLTSPPVSAAVIRTPFISTFVLKSFVSVFGIFLL